MIKAKHDGQYKQVGFIKVRQPDGTYKDVEKKYGKTTGGEYDIVFEKGFTREAEGALPLTLSGIGKPLKNYTIEGNIYQSDGVSPDTPQEVVGCGDRTGNLFDKNAKDINNGYISNGYLIDTGEVLESTSYRVSEYISVYPQTDYTLVYGNLLNTPSIVFYNEEKVFLSGQRYSGADTVVITTPQNAVFCRLSFHQSDFSEIMLNSGSAPLPYEPYGYKMDGVSRGKNLFDFNSATFRNFSGSGIGSVDIKDNAVRYTLTESKNNYGFMIIEETEFSKGTYTISADIIDERTDKIDTFGFRVAINGVYNSFGRNYFTITDETALVKISFYMGSPNTGGGYVEVSNIQLETGGTATEYEPYTPPITTPIYLDSPLYKIGDYADVRGMTEEVRAVKELVLTGEENITLYSVSTGNLFRVSLPVNRILDNFYGTGVCSHYTPVLYTAERVNGTISGARSEATQSAVDIVDNYSTVDDFKAFLATQYSAGTPVTVYYVLAEPETKTVEPVDIPTLNGTTVIDVDTEVKPSNMRVEYKSSK